MTAIAYETFHLGRRTLRRFYRVPANPIGVVLYPLIQLIVFSQLYQRITVLPEFGGQSSYLAYLAPGQIAFAAFFTTAWSGSNLIVDQRTGYMDKLRVTPVRRWSILAGELVPLFIEAGAMALIILAACVVLGAGVATGVAGALMIAILGGLLGVAWSGTSFVPALLTRNEQATGTLSILFFPVAFMSTAFVPADLMPEWMQVVNDWNPFTYVIEGMRALMISGWDWGMLGRALLALALFGGALQLATLWAFRRLTA